MAKRNLNEVLGFISRWGESKFSLRLLDEALSSAGLEAAAIEAEKDNATGIRSKQLKAKAQQRKKREDLILNVATDPAADPAHAKKATDLLNKMRLPTNYDPNLEGQKKDPNTGEITIGGKKAQLTKTEEPELTKTEEPESTKIKISRLMAAAGIGTNILSGARALGDSMFGPTGSTVPGAVGAVGHSFQAAGNAVRTVTGKVPVHVLNKLRADRLLGNRRYRRHPKFSPK